MPTNNNPLAEAIARRLLGLPLQGELNLPSQAELAQQQQLPIPPTQPVSAIPAGTRLVQVPQAPTMRQIVNQEEPWPEVIAKAIGSGLTQVATGTVGAASGILENLGANTQEIQHIANEVNQFLAPKVGKSKAKSWASGIIQSTINSLAQYVLSKRLGIPLLPMFGVTSGGQKYLQVRQQGYGPKKALESAIPTGISEALTEKIPFDAVFKDVGKPVVKRLLKLYGGELLGENINTLTEDIVDQAVLKKPMTMHDYIQDLVDTTVITLGQTSLTGLPGIMAQRQVEQRKKAIPTPEQTVDEAIKEATKQPTPEQQTNAVFDALPLILDSLRGVKAEPTDHQSWAKAASKAYAKVAKAIPEEDPFVKKMFTDIAQGFSFAASGRKISEARKDTLITQINAALNEVDEWPDDVPGKQAMHDYLTNYLATGEALPTKEKVTPKKAGPTLEDLGFRKKEIERIGEEDRKKILENKITRKQVVMKRDGTLVYKEQPSELIPKKEQAIPQKKKAAPKKKAVPKKEAVTTQKSAAESLQETANEFKKLGFTIDEISKIGLVEAAKIRKNKITRDQVKITPEGKVIYKKKQALPTTLEEKEKLKPKLVKLGYSESQIERLRPEAAKEILKKKLPAENVSVLQNGNYKAIKALPKEKTQAKEKTQELIPKEKPAPKKKTVSKKTVTISQTQRKSLKKLGYSDKQISRLAPEAIKEVIKKKIKAENVSITKKGTIKTGVNEVEQALRKGKKIKKAAKKPLIESELRLPKLEGKAKESPELAAKVYKIRYDGQWPEGPLMGEMSGAYSFTLTKETHPVFGQKGGASTIMVKKGELHKLPEIIKQKVREYSGKQEILSMPELIPGHPVRSEVTNIQRAPSKKKRLFKVNMKTLKKIKGNVTEEDKISAAYPRFQPSWEKATGKGKYIVLNLGRTKYVKQEAKARGVEDKDLFKLDYLLSAKEWLAGTNFRKQIDKGLITEKEAQARLRFFDKYSENVFRFKSELTAGLTDMFRKWAEGRPYDLDPEEPDSPHINNIIIESMGSPKEKIKPRFTLEELLHPPKGKEKDISQHLAYGLSYAIMDRYIRLSKNVGVYNLETLLDNMLTYGLVHYEMALNDEDSFFFNEMAPTELTDDQIKQILNNTTFDEIADFLANYHFFFMKENMGLHKLDTVTGLSAGLMKYTMDLVKNDQYFENTEAGRLLRNEVKNVVFPTIQRIIKAADRLMVVSKDLKHIVGIKGLMKKLERTIMAYQEQRITDPDKYIRTLKPYWEKVILPQLSKNERAIAEKIGNDEFIKAEREGLAEKVLNGVISKIDVNQYFPDGFKRVVTTPNTNAYQALLYLSKNGNSASIRYMASILSDLDYTAKVLPDVRIAFESVGPSSQAGFRHSTANVGDILLDPGRSSESLEWSFLHEATHALTLYRLENNPFAKRDINKLRLKAIEHISPNERKLGEYLIKQAKAFEPIDKKKLAKMIEGDPSYKDHVDTYGKASWLKVLYYLSSPHEFVAGSISSPTMAVFLNEIEVEPKESVWQRVIKVVADLLGIGKDKATLWTESVKTILDNIQESDVLDIYTIKKMRGIEPSEYILKQVKATERKEVDKALKDHFWHLSDLDSMVFAPRIDEYTYENLKGFAKQLIKEYPKAAPKLADIGKVRQAMGLPLWTSLIHPEFAPLFKHVVKAMEEKNFALHTILQHGDVYFSRLNDDDKAVVNSAIKVSDALGIKFTKDQLENFPKTVDTLKRTFDKLYLYRNAPATIRQGILKKMAPFLPKEYSQPEYLKRFKYFFDYALPSLKLERIDGVRADGYYNYREVTNKTAEHISDKILTLIIDAVVKDPIASNTVFAIIRHPEVMENIPKETLASYQDIVKQIQEHPLYKKYETIRDLIDKMEFYSPRYRDQDAAEMIVAFDKEAFQKSFKKFIARTGSKAKALEKVYDDLSRQNKLYLREHVRRIDPDMQKKLMRAKRVFGKDNVVMLLPNYKLAESVYGDITEGNVGSFLETLANKTRTANANPEALENILDEISQTIEQELLARSRAGQKFLHRNPYLILGYHLDKTTEETFNYVNNAANYMARMDALINGLPLLNRIDPKQQPKLRDYAHKWLFDQLKPQSQFDKIVGKTKAYMFLWYLSGMLRPAAVQATQMFVSTIPLAKTIYKMPISKSTSLFMKAYKDVLFHGNVDENPELTDDEKKFLSITYNKGVTTAQFINQIRDEVAGSGGWAVKAATWLATPFAYMEQSNRLATALGVYRYFKEGNPDLRPDDPTVINEATDLINMTHFLMGKLNLPSIATGGTVPQGLARLSVTFRSFTMNLMELYNYTLRHMPASKKLWGLNKEGLEFVAYSFLAFTMFGGILSIPFLDDLIKLLERQTGEPLRKKFFKRVGDINSPLAYSLERGLPSLIGVDLSGSLKIEIPTSPSDVLNTIFGVYGGLAKSATDSLTAYQGFDKINAVYRLLPQFVGDPLKAYEAYKGLKNQYNKPVYDENGKPIKATIPEALLIATGFRPARFGRTYGYKDTARNISIYFQKKRDKIYNMFRSADTPAKRQKVLKEIAEYNKEASKFITVPRITFRSLSSAVRPRREKIAEELKMRGY